MRIIDKIILVIATICALFNLFELIPTFLDEAGQRGVYMAIATAFITGFGYCGLLWCIFHEAFRRKNGI